MSEWTVAISMVKQAAKIVKQDLFNESGHRSAGADYL